MVSNVASRWLSTCALVATCACGRFGFDVASRSADATRATDARPSSDAIGPTGDGALACSGQDSTVDLNANGVADCAENLVGYGQFTSNAGPWSSGARATIAWTSNDARGLASSGSVTVTDIVMSTTINGGSVTPSDCIVVAPNTTYGIYTNYWMASGQPGGDGNNAAWITLQTYTDPGCQNPNSSVSGGALGMTKDAWDLYVRTYLTLPTDRSMQLELGVLKGATTAAVAAQFDNVLIIAQ